MSIPLADDFAAIAQRLKELQATPATEAKPISAKPIPNFSDLLADHEPDCHNLCRKP